MTTRNYLNVFINYFSAIKNNLNKEENLWLKIGVIVFLAFVLYVILFFSLKAVAVNKIKNYMVKSGIVSDARKVVLKINADPFTFYAGNINSVYFKSDDLIIKNIVILHDVEIKTKRIKFYGIDLKKFDFTKSSAGASVRFRLYENDFLYFVNNKMNFLNKSVNVSSRNGTLFFSLNSNIIKTEYKAKPFMQNNSLYLKFDDGIMGYMKPVKIVDFGMLSKRRLNIYSFDYNNNSFEFKGTLI